MNNKIYIILITIYGLVIMALIVRNGSVLLLSVPFLIYLMLGVYHAPEDIILVADRQIDGVTFDAQEPIPIHVTIENGGIRLVNLTLDDSLLPSMKILDGHAQKRLSLSAGEKVELRYVVCAKRGVYSWSSVHAIACDPFELFSLERYFPATGNILVRPEMMKLRNNPLKPLKTIHTQGQILSGRAGAGTDFFGIREYSPGDSLRHINWHMVSRRPHQLFTNEYEREQIADYGLILDTRRLTRYFGKEDALFERSVSAAASLSETIVKSGNRIALLIFGVTMTSLFPGFGKRQLNQVIRNLASATMSSYIPFEYLKYISTRLFPSKTIVLVFSTLDSQDMDAYTRLRAYGYEILIISPDPVDHAIQSIPQTKIDSLAIRAARVERVLLLKRLMKMGIKVIDWKGDDSLSSIVQKASRHLSSRRNVNNCQ